MERLIWKDYFMEMAHLVKMRSTCLRRQVGAVIVKDNRVLATGYNGVPSGFTHCAELGCLRERLNIPSGERHELCSGLHAEQNAIIQAALHGVSIYEATLFCTTMPCIICLKMIINAGLRKIFYEDGYPDHLTLHMIDEAMISVEKMVRNQTNE